MKYILHGYQNECMLEKSLVLDKVTSMRAYFNEHEIIKKKHVANLTKIKYSR